MVAAQGGGQVWSAQDIEELQALADRKFSGGQIAKRMGRTRNAVIGKCFRERIMLDGRHSTPIVE